MRKVVVLLALFILLSAKAALAANSTISGVLTNIDGTTCNLCQVGFNSLTTQTIAGTTYQPKFVTTTTDSSGNLAPITLPQGIVVQVTVSEQGQTFAPYTAIVPFLSAATFNQLNQGTLLNPLNVLASQQPPTGPLSMNSQKITTLACPSNSGDALAWGCNATVNNLTVTGGFTQNTSGAGFFGMITDSAIGNPGAPTVVAIGTTGITSYTYFVACHDGNGGTTLASSGTTITNGNATLNGTNYNQVAFTLPSHALNCDILRGDTGHSIALAQTVSPFNDQGGSTTAYTAPTRNTTGDGQFAGALSAGSTATGIATGDLGASESATVGRLLLGSNGSQGLDFGLTNASKFTLVGGGLVLPTGNLAVTNNETVGGTLAITGVTTLTGGLNTPLSIANGGNGTASPGLTAGANVTLTGTWPTQNIAVANVTLRSNLQTGNPLNTVSNSTAETTLFTYSLAGNTLGTSGVLTCHAEGNYLNNSGSNQIPVLKFYYGSGAILTLNMNSIAASATQNFWNADIRLNTTGATNTEEASVVQQTAQALGDGLSVLGGSNNPVYSRNAGVAVDSTVNQTVKLTVQMPSNTATQTFNIFSENCQLQ